MSGRGSRSFTEQQLREAVARSTTMTEALRLLGLRPAGGNFQTFRRWVTRWEISTDHFDPRAASAAAGRWRTRPLEEVLTVGSRYQRQLLKERLYAAGLKQRRCELCGQGEEWCGRRMSLILDHVNGDAEDNRLENLRIVCANCNATLDTHCGRNKRRRASRECAHCGERFHPRSAEQRFCCRGCSVRFYAPDRRRVERPSREQLAAELAASSYVAVARRYGVSDNAVRKWERAYEWDEDGPAPASGPVSPPPR